MVKFILSSIMSNTTLNLVAIFKTPKPCKNICYKFLISKLLANSFEFDAGIGPLNGWFFYGSLSPWTKYTMHIQHFDEMTNIVSHGEEQCVNVSCDSKITACTVFSSKLCLKYLINIKYGHTILFAWFPSSTHLIISYLDMTFLLLLGEAIRLIF